MKKIRLLLYYCFSSKLPNSWFPGGKLYNKIRRANLRGVVSVGGNTKIQRGVYIGSGNNVSIGRNCQVNENTRLDNVQIGNHVMIARECIVLGKMHENSSAELPMSEQGVKPVQPTIIEDDVWLGLRVIVMPGVTIRKGCIVAAGAVLTKDTEPYGVYAGVPAKRIKNRNHA